MGFFSWASSKSRQATYTTNAQAPPPPPAAPPAASLPLHDASRLIHKPYEHSSIGIRLTTGAGVTKIHGVTPGSASFDAGLVVGDIVRSINGEPVESATVGAALLQTAPAGFVEIIVQTTVASPCVSKAFAYPIKSEFDNDIELLPTKSAIPTFDKEVVELAGMGFTDTQRARHALCAVNGDVQAAVERLLAENV